MGSEMCIRDRLRPVISMDRFDTYWNFVGQKPQAVGAQDDHTGCNANKPDCSVHRLVWQKKLAYISRPPAGFAGDNLIGVMALERIRASY